MTRLSILAGVAALALAGPAAAQVGGLTGQVGGSVGGAVGVQTPPLGSTLDNAGGLAQDTVDRTRDTAEDTADDARTLPGSAEAQANADGSISAGQGSAAADLDVSAGAMVHGSDGAMLGSVSSVVRDSAGRVQSLIVATADGATKTVPATGASVQGGAVVTGWTESQFDAAPND